MNAKYIDGNISIDLTEIFESLDKETRIEISECIACDSEIIKHVTDQIIEKWTENGFFGSTCCTATHGAYHGLDYAWRRVAKSSGDVAKREIERLEKALKTMTDRYYELANEKANENRSIY